MSTSAATPLAAFSWVVVGGSGGHSGRVRLTQHASSAHGAVLVRFSTSETAQVGAALLTRVCQVCKVASSELFQCSKCHLGQYCGVSCQRRDFKMHRRAFHDGSGQVLSALLQDLAAEVAAMPPANEGDSP